ncbi:hypothetical protein ACQPW1_22075 [Nocardia sp. CA-128927]|uniref:hypothetical protein n=1 Tax=Nocardia sp. CA-128927 TaxID=3239975 RepID=UPI003D95427D
MTTTVGDNGFTAAVGAVEVAGDAGVAPTGTPVTVAVVSTQLNTAQAELADVIAAPISIRLGDGSLQPATPITVRYNLSGLPADRLGGNTHRSVPQLLAQHEGEQNATWTDAVWDPDTKVLTARLAQLSTIFPFEINWDQTSTWLGQKWGEVTGTRFPKPACAFVDYVDGGTKYQLSHVNSPGVGPVLGTDDVVWPCLARGSSGGAALTLHSNTSLVWDATTDPPAPGVINTDTIATVDDVFNWIAGEIGSGLDSGATQILTGGSTSFASSVPPASATLTPNAGLTTFQILVTVMKIVTDRLTTAQPLALIKPAGECVRKAMDLAPKNPSNIDDVLSSARIVAQCLITYAEQTGAVTEKGSNILALAHDATELFDRFDGQARGLVATLSGPATLIIARSTDSGGPSVLPFTGPGDPQELASTSNGDVFITTSANRIVEIAAGATAQTTLPVTAPSGFGQIAVDAMGNVFATTIAPNQVLKLSPGSTSAERLSFPNVEPFGISVDGSGDVFVSGIYNSEPSPTGTHVFMLAPGASTPIVLPFTGLNGATWLASNASGDVFASDGNQVSKLAAGASTPTVQPFTGLNGPRGLAVDTSGNVFVADSNNARVVKLAAQTNVQTVVPFTGLIGPESVAVDGAGDVFVSDNHKVLKLTAS